MTLQRRRRINWIISLLVAVGCLALVSGIAMAVSSVTFTINSPLSLNVSRHKAVYVGANTCYTCHKDNTRETSLSPHTQTNVKPVAVEAEFEALVAVPQQQFDTIAKAYTTQAEASPSASLNTQDYVVRTESGWTLLHGRGTAENPVGEALSPEGAPVACSICHSGDLAQAYADGDATSDQGQTVIVPKTSGWWFIGAGQGADAHFRPGRIFKRYM